MLDLTALEQQISEQMTLAHVPGLALAIVKDHDIFYARGFGVTSVEDGELPVTPQTLFRIGSTTKSLTGTAVMRLVEAGMLDLDRPITDYLPWLILSEAGVAARITLRMLMSHTAGMPRGSPHLGRRDPDGLQAYVGEVLPSVPFVAPPGKLYSYCDNHIILVGAIAEAVTGTPFTDLMQELIFDPLHMRRTTFDPTVAMTYPLAQAHIPHGASTLHVNHRFTENTAKYPSALAISTVLDLANFALLHLHQGRFQDRQLLSPTSVVTMHAPHADLCTPTGTHYGLTFFLEPYQHVQCIGHAGAIDSFGCRFELIPETGLAVIMLFNWSSDFWLPAHHIIEHIFDQLLDLPRVPSPPTAVPTDRSAWPGYVGSYLGLWLGLLTIYVEGEQLLLDWNGEVVPLRAIRTGVYVGSRPARAEMVCTGVYVGSRPARTETVCIGFVPEAAGPSHHIVVHYGQGDHYSALASDVGQRITDDALPVPDRSVWASFVGTYIREGDRRTIAIEQQQLVMHTEQSGMIARCMPVAPTQFACSNGLIQFQIAADGTAAAFTLRHAFTFRRIGGT